MRPDLAKVVTERPRHKGYDNGDHRSAENILDEDMSIKHEPMSMGRGTKQFTDVLGPLVGYLRKQVGRPWDDVYSEICQNFNKNSTTQLHIIDHIFQYVEIHVRMIDGEPYDSAGVYRINRYRGGEQFYVHPETGLLCQCKQIKFNTKKTKKKKLTEVDGRSFKKIDGIWYELTLVPYPPAPTECSLYPEYKIGGMTFFHPYRLYVQDAVLGHITIQYTKSWYSKVSDYSMSPAEKFYGKKVYCTAKRQINGREIRKLKLNESSQSS